MSWRDINSISSKEIGEVLLFKFVNKNFEYFRFGSYQGIENNILELTFSGQISKEDIVNGIKIYFINPKDIK